MIDKSLILNKIKNHYGFVKDSDFAKFLEITPQTLSNWKARNTFDPVLVYTKCEELNPHWLLLGEGPILKINEKTYNTPTSNLEKEGYFDSQKDHTPLANPSQDVSKKEIFDKKLHPTFDEKLHPTLHPTPENCRICDEKERIISSMEITIEALQEANIQLKKRLIEQEKDQRQVG